jgi:hypothetical protein
MGATYRVERSLPGRVRSLGEYLRRIDRAYVQLQRHF